MRILPEAVDQREKYDTKISPALLISLHQPHLLVLDSPNLSLKERGEDIGTEIASDSMRGGLFKYMIDHEDNRQTIVLEDEIPRLDYSAVNLIHFTKKPDEGRFGLIEGFQEL